MVRLCLVLPSVSCVERGGVLGFFNLLVVLRKGVFVFGASMCELC